MMSTPSGRVTLKTSVEMDLTSMGRVEAQLCVASYGKSYGYVARWETAAWASGHVSVQMYEDTAYPALRRTSRPVAMPPKSSAVLMGRLGINYVRTCPSAGRAQ